MRYLDPLAQVVVPVVEHPVVGGVPGGNGFGPLGSCSAVLVRDVVDVDAEQPVATLQGGADLILHPFPMGRFGTDQDRSDCCVLESIQKQSCESGIA